MEMNDISRQEDLRMTSSSRNKLPQQEIVPEEDDIHTLLAFAQHLNGNEFGRSPLRRITTQEPENQPEAYPTCHPWRLNKVLDSLANISVAQAQGEVIATAFRQSKSDSTLEIIVASNGAVPRDTINYLTTIWSLLRMISTHVRHLPRVRSQTSPPDIPQKGELVNLVRRFEIEVVKFTFLKIRKRIAKLHNIPSDHVSPVHPINNVKRFIAYFDRRFPRKPDDDDRDAWDRLRKMLKGACDAINTCLDHGLSEEWPTSRRASLERSLRKFLSIETDNKVMTRVAASPQCMRIFDHMPDIIPLPEQRRAVNIPDSSDRWEMAMERLLMYYNQSPNVSQQLMDPDIVRRDCDAISDRPYPYPQTAPVHCEVKLFLHLWNEQHRPINPKPPAYSYIGVSKLSCLACFGFQSAFNNVHRTRFVTKGTHSKAYFPWAFPEGCPRHNRLLEKVYQQLTNHFVPWYHAFVPESVPLAPDSTARSDPSQGGLWTENIDEEEIEKEFKNWDV